MAARAVRMGELVATLTLGQDNAFGQPLESQLRSCVLASWLCDAARFDTETGEASFWVALLRYIGCTGHAHEVSALFGDEIALRARTLVHDAADPGEVAADLLDFAAPDPDRLAIVRAVLSMGRDAIAPNFAAGCEIGDALVARLGMSPAVRAALRCTFERWNGTGFPDGVSGHDIPLAMRVVHLTHDVEAIARHRSPADAMRTVAGRRDRTYDPMLVDVFIANGERWLAALDTIEPWSATLELEPRPHRQLAGGELDDALTVIADFVDLKSPFTSGHSRRCAALAGDAGTRVGLSDDETTELRRAALVHDLGITAVPNSIWDKPGPLTTAERDRVRLHPLLTEQMLRRTPAFAAIAAIAAAHHEKADGSGYHRGARHGAGEVAANVLAATDIYVGLLADRADRAGFALTEAAAELRRLATSGQLDPRAVEAVLAAAGQDIRPRRRALRPQHPAGLTDREVEVLRLAAGGLTVNAIATQLYISPKTVEHHIQHIYHKIGVSSRGAAALWAMHHRLTTFTSPS